MSELRERALAALRTEQAVLGGWYEDLQVDAVLRVVAEECDRRAYEAAAQHLPQFEASALLALAADLRPAPVPDRPVRP